MKARPLTGVRIIDFTHVVAGPVATSLLGTLGAEVVKIENPALRGGVSALARLRNMELNRSKMSVTLNLLLPEGQALAKRLVALADVVIDNFSPRVMQNFGLEYEDLISVKEDIIVVSMPAFGRTGPFRDRISFGPGIDAISGLSHITGYPDSTPLKPGNVMGDYNAAGHAALAIMAALMYRKKTGKGEHIEVAMRDAETQLLGEYILGYQLNGRIEQRAANRHPTVAPHNVYPCAGHDKWLAIAVDRDDEWAALCGVMGRADLATDARFSTSPARKANEEAVDEVVAAWTRDQDHIALMGRLQAAGVPAGAVMTTAEIAADPHYRSREAFPEFDAGDGATMRLARPGWRAEHATAEIARGPNYSEHTRQILTGLLGLDEAELRALHERGVINLVED